MTQSGSATRDRRRRPGKVNVQDLTLTKYVDKSTPTLMKVCCSGDGMRQSASILHDAQGGRQDPARVPARSR